MVDPSFFIAFELGKLSIINLELKNLKDELDQAKQDILEKYNLLKESLAAQEVLTQHVRLAKYILTEAKHATWDSLLREIKKIKGTFCSG